MDKAGDGGGKGHPYKEFARTQPRFHGVSPCNWIFDLAFAEKMNEL
jgi:hypothetical protein